MDGIDDQNAEKNDFVRKHVAKIITDNKNEISVMEKRGDSLIERIGLAIS